MAQTKVIAYVRLNGTDIAVEIKSVFKSGDGRKIAVVEALPVNGKQIEPFTSYSIGGGYQSDTANIRLDLLKGISRVEEIPQPQPQPSNDKVIAILAEGGKDVAVQVLAVYTGIHGEKIAEVKALPIQGRKIAPFTDYSSDRGPAITNITRVQVDKLKGLSLAKLPPMRTPELAAKRGYEWEYQGA